MKKCRRFLSAIFAALIIISCVNLPAHAQFDNIGDFLRSGSRDAEILTKAYLKPFGKGIGGSLNTGWFNSASTHNTLGFDIQVRGALALIPDDDQTFNFNELNTSDNIELAKGQSPISPTIGGDNTQGPSVTIKDDDGNPVGEFNLPEGTGFQYVPAPMIQASVGTIKNTDVMVRLVPEVSLDDYGSFNMLGFGLKHSITQWIPGGKFLPVNIALMAGYNRVNLDANLDVQPQEPGNSKTYDNQQVKTSIKTFTFKILASKDLPFLSVYAGAGYETSTFNLDVLGTYPTARGSQEAITDPFSYNQDGANNFSLTGGLKFKLFFFHIFGDYTLAKYPVANAGIGFSFR